LVTKDKIPTNENIPFKKKDVAFWKCVAQKKILTPNIIGKKFYVTTLTLGSRTRQRGCKGAGQEEARESHHVFPGV